MDTFTDDNFADEVLAASGIVVVDFWADWSGASHIMTPILEQLAADFEGKAKIGRLDVECNTRIPNEYAIQSVPVILLFGTGQVVDCIQGITSREELASKLNALLGDRT